jgi:hypothetical protein
MKKLIIGGLAALAIGLTAAPVAQAAPYTAADLDFIAAVTDLGYYGDKDRLIKTGHVVCELLDDEANWQTIEAEIVIHHGSGRKDEGYYAAWFEQYAVYHYCPRHSDKLGVI